MSIRVGRLSVRCARRPFLSPTLVRRRPFRAQSLVACDCLRSNIGVVWCSPAVDEPVFAAYRTPAGRWSVVAPACRDLSGRTGVHRIAALDEPAASGAEVIRLRERVGADRRA